MTNTETSEHQNLAAKRLPELRAIAHSMGLRGISAKRKGELIEAILAGQTRYRSSATEAAESSTPSQEERQRGDRESSHSGYQRRAHNSVSAEQNDGEQPSTDTGDDASGSGEDQPQYRSGSAARRARRHKQRQLQRERRENDPEHNSSEESNDASHEDFSDENKHAKQDSDSADGNDSKRGDKRDNNRDGNGRNRRNRRDNSGRGRRGRSGNGNQNQHDNSDDSHDEDQLRPVAGILDIVDNNVAFVRTTGYQSGAQDVFVNQNLIRRNGLRRGDAITGHARMGGGNSGGRGNNRRQKYNPLVRVETVNGISVDEARQRPEFSKLTPLYPNKRLRLETDPKILTTRVIDLIMPIGKGQRALIVSPPKAGKTTILQNIANAISTNNPECYLMVVLVDERPEEVTDMQRSVKGEVIASTFDRPPSEHTSVAELAIERAKRLVEQGQDVVVLLDSITRLGRAYNNSSPASGRILSGGVDSNALYPPKRFLGAARNIENGGSLTIIATAMVETGSAGDTVIFEEFKGTGNAELKLDRRISERRVFPAVDVNPSGTRKDDLLLAPEEARVMHKLRRILSALDNQQAIDLLIKQLKKTKNNAEFLTQIASSAPMAGAMEEDYS